MVGVKYIIKNWPLWLGMVLFGGILVSGIARGESDSHFTPSQLGYIKSTCTTTDSSLNQLHTNDALLRVNLGQMYESISTRLIKRFNSRVAYNNLNNSDLVNASNQYDQGLNLFRNSYRDYEVSLDRLITMDCSKYPDEFYVLLENTREKRRIVRRNIESINEALDGYRGIVTDFENNYRLIAEGSGAK